MTDDLPRLLSEKEILVGKVLGVVGILLGVVLAVLMLANVLLSQRLQERQDEIAATQRETIVAAEDARAAAENTKDVLRALCAQFERLVCPDVLPAHTPLTDQ